MENVQLGKTYKCEISGFVGVATGKCEYLKGNTRIELTGNSVEGKTPASDWFNANLLAEVTPQ